MANSPYGSPINFMSKRELSPFHGNSWLGSNDINCDDFFKGSLFDDVEKIPASPSLLIKVNHTIKSEIPTKNEASQ